MNRRYLLDTNIVMFWFLKQGDQKQHFYFNDR
jgi:hypothetical protein